MTIHSIGGLQSVGKIHLYMSTHINYETRQSSIYDTYAADLCVWTTRCGTKSELYIIPRYIYALAGKVVAELSYLSMVEDALMQRGWLI